MIDVNRFMVNQKITLISNQRQCEEKTGIIVGINKKKVLCSYDDDNKLIALDPAQWDIKEEE